MDVPVLTVNMAMASLKHSFIPDATVEPTSILSGVTRDKCRCDILLCSATDSDLGQQTQGRNPPQFR